MIDENGYIRCDCCHKEILGKLTGERLTIEKRKHGELHIAVIDTNILIPKGSVLIPIGFKTN